jgi:hypothetical protein
MLAHELWHANLADGGGVSEDLVSGTGVAQDEVEATMIENEQREADGCELRDSYGGADVPTPSRVQVSAMRAHDETGRC